MKVPHTFTIVFALIVLSAILTWIVPGGEYDRKTITTGDTEREVVITNSYHQVESSPQTWQVFSAFFKGFVDKADIIIFILIVGGAFWIINESKAIDTGIKAFLGLMERLGKGGVLAKVGVNNIIITLIMLLFGVFGAVFGMSEETIAFVIIFVPMAISMGYDSIVGICMCYLAAHLGFAGAVLNPFTVGIAQGIAGLPLFSGIEYRCLCWLVIMAVGITAVLLYARRIKKNPQASPTYKIDEYWRNRRTDGEAAMQEDASTLGIATQTYVCFGLIEAVLILFAVFFPQTHLHIAGATVVLPLLPVLAGLFAVGSWLTLKRSAAAFVMNLLLFAILYLIVGVLGYGWYIGEIAALFLALGIAAGMASGKSADDMAKLFLAGAKDILSASLVVGLASGIIFILRDGKIIDTLLCGLTNMLSGAGKVTSMGVMYVFTSLLNVVMPSGSAKAALLMPIMSQFADLAELSRQTAVMVFQFGSGITETIAPTSGVLIGCLGVARIPYPVWVKWFWKLLLILVVVGFLLVIPTMYIPLNGF